jgi:hypothetical protein
MGRGGGGGEEGPRSGSGERVEGDEAPRGGGGEGLLLPLEVWGESLARETVDKDETRGMGETLDTPLRPSTLSAPTLNLIQTLDKVEGRSGESAETRTQCTYGIALGGGGEEEMAPSSPPPVSPSPVSSSPVRLTPTALSSSEWCHYGPQPLGVLSPSEWSHSECRFIFHAVGSWNKWSVMVAMLQVLRVVNSKPRYQSTRVVVRIH